MHVNPNGRETLHKKKHSQKEGEGEQRIPARAAGGGSLLCQAGGSGDQDEQQLGQLCEERHRCRHTNWSKMKPDTESAVSLFSWKENCIPERNDPLSEQGRTW